MTGVLDEYKRRGGTDLAHIGVIGGALGVLAKREADRTFEWRSRTYRVLIGKVCIATLDQDAAVEDQDTAVESYEEALAARLPVFYIGDQGDVHETR